MQRALVTLLLLVQSFSAKAESKALWEYGFGLGFAHFSHYPGSDQYRTIALPFPTFQYRGEILRADDQEGSRAYLFKNHNWSLEFAGGGRLPTASKDNKARSGMMDLPLVAQAGPQLVYNDDDRRWFFKTSIFPSYVIDGTYIRQNGGLANAEVEYRWEDDLPGWAFFDPFIFSGTLSLGVTTATQEFHATYYDVAAADATATRAEYAARAGFLDSSLSYYQSISTGLMSIYVGASYTDYSWSANRDSPLHVADSNLGYALGITYILGESERRAVSVDQTEGLFNKYRLHRPQLLPFR